MLVEAVSLIQSCTELDGPHSPIGLLSQLLAEHAEVLIGVDTNPQSVASYNELVANRNTTPPEEMEEPATTVVESEDETCDGGRAGSRGSLLRAV